MSFETDSVVSDDVSFSQNASSIVSFIRTNSRVKELDDAKRLDPGYVKVYRNIPKTVKGKVVNKRTPIELYTTILTPGKKIRSAIGGSYNNYKIGTADEYVFFKVGLCTGECKGESNTLFFDTPEQYERLFNINLSNSIKQEWYNRFHEERLYREKLANVSHDLTNFNKTIEVK